MEQRNLISEAITSVANVMNEGIVLGRSEKKAFDKVRGMIDKLLKIKNFVSTESTPTSDLGSGSQDLPIYSWKKYVTIDPRKTISINIYLRDDGNVVIRGLTRGKRERKFFNETMRKSNFIKNRTWITDLIRNAEKVSSI